MIAKIMELLPTELNGLILAILPMPDKRNLIRCNMELNKINIKWYEDEFLKMIWTTEFLDYDKYQKRITKIERYTLEMIYYGYDKLIPKRYICNKNELLYKYPKMYFNCAVNNHIRILKILMTCNKTYLIGIAQGAARAGHLEMLKWTRENGCEDDANICTYAAASGQLEVLKWAHDNGCTWDVQTCANAAASGQLEVLKWAHDNGCTWDAQTCANAAASGQLEVLKWARDNDCKWDSMTCTFAAYGGHIKILKWARDNCCDWDPDTCSMAALNGHLEVLKWARDNGCDWDSMTCSNAAKNGRVGIRFFKSNTRPKPTMGSFGSVKMGSE